MISSSRHGSAAMANIIAPTNGVRGQMASRGQKPKNHMQEHRQALKLQEKERREKVEMMSTTTTERFVMKKFQNVESKVTTGRPSTATTRGGLPRPPTTGNTTKTGAARASGQENFASQNSARNNPKAPAQVAFGKNYRSGSAMAGASQQVNNQANNNDSGATEQKFTLTTSNLTKFDRRTSSNIGYKRPIDPEVVVFTGEEAQMMGAQAAQEPGPDQTPIHKNYGKVPKYIAKYKEEAAELTRQREELREKKRMPPGMCKMDEAERVVTLEQLQSTRRELQTMLQTLPISMRSENLRLKKRELEQRLDDVERSITTFSRKVVYIQE